MNIDIPLSLYDRVIGRKRPLTVTLFIVFILFASASIAGSLEYGWAEFFAQHHWRNFFLPPAIISYLLLVSPRLSKMDQKIVQSLQPLIGLDDKKLNTLIRELLSGNPLKEVVAFSGGGILGLIMVLSGVEFTFNWLMMYFSFMIAVMYGLLAWAVYINLSSYNFIPTLLSQPLSINLFDITPLKSIGRQSLLLAMVFAGGITLSLIFMVEAALFLTLQFWVIYIPLGLCPLIIFFSNMIPTHRVISEKKEQELEKIRQPIQKLSRKMLELLDEEKNTYQLAAEINALSNYEKRLENINTWPYDFAMLNKVFFSLLLPSVVIILKIIL